MCRRSSENLFLFFKSALLLCCLLSRIGEASSPESIYQALKDAAQQELANTGTPSLQIAVASDTSKIMSIAVGLADVENQVPAKNDTKYRTASVAKWFTASAALLLSEKGNLDLDAPVQKYCSDYPVKHWPITTRQLVSHTAGVRHYIDFEAEIRKATSKSVKAALEKQQLLEQVSEVTRYTDVIAPLNSFKNDPLMFEPGTDWLYSSFGYRLLACVVQGAAKQTYTSLMEALIFTPSGMTHTQADDAWTIISERSAGYHLNRDRSLRNADLRDVSENLPAGGYLSTATDLVKFALAYNSTLVSPKTRKLMSESQHAPLDNSQEKTWRDAIPQADKYGYGLMLFSKYEPGLIGHTGRQAGGSAILLLQPNTGVAVAVMTNAKGWNGFLPFALKIKSIFEKYLEIPR